MNAIDLGTSLVFLLIGLSVLIYILTVVWRAVGAQDLDFISGFLQKLHTSKLEKIDILISSNRLSDAFLECAKSFRFALPRKKNANVQADYAHNIEIFRRLVRSTEGLTSPVKEIAILEELISSRAALTKSWVEAHLTRSTLKNSGPEKSWAFDEFDTRVKELEEKLDTNKRSLLTQIDSLRQRMESSLNESVTYH